MSCAGISPQVQVPAGDVRWGYGSVVPYDHDPEFRMLQKGLMRVKDGH